MGAQLIHGFEQRSELETTDWDVAVIGAGPGGSLAARESARLGLRTLLIEGRAFPRPKVCGGCLNSRALRVLSTVGLQCLVDDLQGEPIRGMSLQSAGRSAFIELPLGLSVTRQSLDTALIDAAKSAGTTVITETNATVELDSKDGFRQLTLRQQDRSLHLRARAVVCADGLLRSSLRALPEMGPCPAPDARMGVGIILTRDQLSPAVAEQFSRERITMLVGLGGYVGLAWAEHNQLSLAAAVDPRVVKQTGSPAVVVQKILKTNGIDFPTIESGWYGTPPLTTVPRWNAAERLFVIGDAAGYVEPFTGEGMAAALEQSLAVLPFLTKAVHDWQPELATAWQEQHRSRFRRRQRVCRMASAFLRRPWLSSTALILFRIFPRVAGYFVNSINRPSTLPPSIPIEQS